MGFELIPGWTPEAPAPIALCDNPACADPIMPAAGWAIAALAPPDPARPDRRRAVRVYLACGDACLAAVRARVGGDWSAPLPYGVYWRAIGPRVADGVTAADPPGDPPADATGRAVEPTTLFGDDPETRAAVAAAEAIIRAHQYRPQP